MSRTVVVTGANGFLGTALCRRFAEAGWAVRAGVREPGRYQAPAAGITAFRCNLPDAVDEAAFEGADVCLHAAYVTQFRTVAEAKRVNFEGTRRVLALARCQPACYFLFVSSCSAHEGALSLYGRSKLALEKELDPKRDGAIRPGLVLGHDGLFWRLRETVGKSPAIPVFDGGRQPFQLITLEQTVDAMMAMAERRAAGVCVAASEDHVTMRELLRALQRHTGRRGLLLSFPSALMLPCLRAAERLGLRLPVSSENLLGLRGARVQDPRPTEKQLGLRFLPAREALRQVLASR